MNIYCESEYACVKEGQMRKNKENIPSEWLFEALNTKNENRVQCQIQKVQKLKPNTIVASGAVENMVVVECLWVFMLGAKSHNFSLISCIGTRCKHCAPLPTNQP